MGGNLTISKASATIDNAMSQTMKSTMTSEIDARMTSECQNTQMIENVRNCSVKFAQQSCASSVIGNTITSASFISTAQQTAAADLSANAKASIAGTTGLFNASVGDSKTFVRNAMNSAVDMVQAFSTVCSRSAIGVNLQSVKNTECTPENTIDFEPQDIDTSIISDCAVETAGQSQSTQDLKATVAASSASSITGIDLTTIVVIAAIAFVIAQVSVVFLGGFFQRRIPYQEQVLQMHSKIFWVFMGLSIATAIAGSLAAYFLSEKARAQQGACKPETGMTLEAGGVAHMPSVVYSPCTIDSDYKTCSFFDNYPGCGITACNNTNAQEDLVRFKNAKTLCSMLGGSAKTPSGCAVSTLITQLFPTREKLSDCSRCADGSFVKASSDPAEVLARCKDMADGDFAALRKYFVVNEPCPLNDPFCMTKDTDLHPSDCLLPEYQFYKRQLSQKMRLCEELDKSMPSGKSLKKTETAGVQNLARQCDIKYEDFFKCTKISEQGEFSCSYTGELNCQNDYSTCTDTSYLKDYAVYNDIQNKCLAERTRLNRLVYIVPGSLFAATILFAVLSIFSYRQIAHLPMARTVGKSNMYGDVASSASSTTGTKLKLFLSVIVTVAGILIGLAMVASSAKSDKDPLYDSNLKWFKIKDQNQKAGYMIGGWVLVSVGCLAGLFFLKELKTFMFG